MARASGRVRTNDPGGHQRRLTPTRKAETRAVGLRQSGFMVPPGIKNQKCRPALKPPSALARKFQISLARFSVGMLECISDSILFAGSSTNSRADFGAS